MTRRGLHLTASLLFLAAGCGGDSPATPDAGSVKGSWKLVSQTVGGAATPDNQVDGSLVIGDTEMALATAVPESARLVGYTASADGRTFTLSSGETANLTLTAEPRLTLALSTGRVLTFTRDAAPPADTFTVNATVTAPGVVPDRTVALLAFLNRDAPGFVNDDSRVYKPVVFNGKTATVRFDLDREALGTQRIELGSNTGIAIAFVVIFQEIDGDGTLEELFAPCQMGSGHDCVVGVSSIALGYRAGSSAELAASPFAYLRAGWSNAVRATDQRTSGGRAGLVSLDGAKVIPLDVTLATDPAQQLLMPFDLGQAGN